jgi:hypothetical protein
MTHTSLAAALAVDAQADAELRDAIECVLSARDDQIEADGDLAALASVYQRLTGWQSTPVDNPVDTAG